MKDKRENYTLVLNTYAVSANRTGNNAALGYTFNVNWDNVLPNRRDIKYLVNFTFF